MARHDAAGRDWARQAWLGDGSPHPQLPLCAGIGKHPEHSINCLGDARVSYVVRSRNDFSTLACRYSALRVIGFIAMTLGVDESDLGINKKLRSLVEVEEATAHYSAA